jgi:hypothetical protein
MNAGERKTRILDLADELIRLLEGYQAPPHGRFPTALHSQCELTLGNMREFRRQVCEDLIPTESGAGFGLTKALGEWAPDEIYMAGHRLETFFMGMPSDGGSKGPEA